MKIVALAAFLLLAAIQSNAQQNSEKVFYLNKVEKYKRMKNAGRVLTVGGTILTVVGIVTLSNSSTTTTYYGGTTHTTTEGNPVGGALAFIAGTAGMGAGIPLWIVGAHAERKYRAKFEESLRLGATLNPQRAGITLTYRF